MQRTVFIFAVAIAWCLAALSPERAIAAQPHVYPYLQNMTPTSVTVCWETRKPVRGSVHFGLDDGLSEQVREAKATTLHQIQLTGLKPGTSYTYRVHTGGTALPTASFTTSPPPGTDNWRIVAYGDNRSNPAIHSKLVKQIARTEPGIVLNTGDLVSAGRVYEYWKTQYFDPLRGLAEHVPIFTCLGNHEQNARHYYDYMNLPDENGEVYYSFEYGNALIIALNSNMADAPFEKDSPQTRWLIDTLSQRRDDQWVIVFFHHPLFRCHPGRGIEPQRWTWHPIFEQYGVDLVLSGHDHYYMRSHPIGTVGAEERPGVTQVTTGGGGAQLYDVEPRPYVESARSTHHFVVLEAEGDTLRGRAIKLDGEVFDEFTVHRQRPTPASQYAAYEMFALEQELRAAIDEGPSVRPGPEGAVANIHLEVPNPFSIPLSMHTHWTDDSAWNTSPPSAATPVLPGEPIRISASAKAGSDSLYPIPRLVVRFTGPDQERRFHNDESVLFPIKLQPDAPLHIHRAQQAPRVDGRLNDGAWKSARVYTEMVSIQGHRVSPHDVRVRLAHRGGWLYVAADVHSPPGSARQNKGKPDSLRLKATEHIRVHVGIGDQAYTFLVNARGQTLDSHRRNRKWDHPFKAKVRASESGWQAEMGIPIKDLAPRGGALRLNVGYRDVQSGETFELYPSFGLASFESRVPTYTGEWSDPTHFAPVNRK